MSAGKAIAETHSGVSHSRSDGRRTGKFCRRNLAILTPPWLRFSILTPGPIQMKQGALIDYRLRPRGIPIRWQSEITAWEPPHRFVDEQRRGPYRR